MKLVVVEIRPSHVQLALLSDRKMKAKEDDYKNQHYSKSECLTHSSYIIYSVSFT